MRTSHLVIIAVLILSLSAMGFVYIQDQQRLEAFKQDNAEKLNTRSSGSLEEKLSQLSAKNEILRQKEIIEELNAEITNLKQQLADANIPSAPSSVSPSTSSSSPSQIESYRAEIERLKQQNKLAMEESGLIVSKVSTDKAEAIKTAQEVATQRPIAKIEEVAADHYFVVLNPIGQPNLTPVNGKKRNVWVRRGEDILLKLTVDSLDADSGKYIATIDSSASPADIGKITVGDEIIYALEAPEEEKPGELPAVPATFLDNNAKPIAPKDEDTDTIELPEPI